MARQKNQPLSARIVARKDDTTDLFRLWLDFGEHRREFRFKPGQYCTIKVANCDNPRNMWRPYSIVSAPHAEYLELFIELVPPPDGNLTPFLHALRRGDYVFVMPKTKGIFTFDPEYKNHVMVATVTGVVPYVSILRNYSHSGMSGHRFFVLHGASYQDEFVYDDELSMRSSISHRLVNKHISTHYVPTISRPNERRNASWRGQEGRVNAIVEDYLSRWGLDVEDTIVYACGHEGMIEDVKKRLVPKGWNVIEEKF